jgi:hypothetical protein
LGRAGTAALGVLALDYRQAASLSHPPRTAGSALQRVADAKAEAKLWH